MTYEKIVEKLQKAYEKAEGWDIGGHKAIQVNVRGEGEGALYIEVSEGKFNVQPYEYYDNDATVTINSKVLTDILDGNEEPDAAFEAQKFSIVGDVFVANKILSLRTVSSVKKVAKKAAEDTKKVAQETKKVAKKAAEETKKAAKKATEETKKVTKEATKKAADSTKKAAKKVAEDTKKVATTAVKAAKEGAVAAAKVVKEESAKADTEVKPYKKPVAVKPSEVVK